MTEHRFGGPWTKEKLTCLQEYLQAYLTIFKKNPNATFFRTIYVDAFAGTGSWAPSVNKGQEDLLFDVSSDEDAIAYRKGSATIALEIDPSFDKYIFIEKDKNYSQKLDETIRQQFPQKADKVEIVLDEANAYLQSWSKKEDWKKHRAVVFLDPYGMQVEWNTISAMAATKGIDLWVLFPLGAAVNRLLTKGNLPKGPWADTLTRMFGTEEWKGAFYGKTTQQDLFGSLLATEKQADFDRISQFWIQRLKSVYCKVAPSPLRLLNSKNVPIYLLCFAASNPKGAQPAVRIAQHILSH